MTFDLPLAQTCLFFDVDGSLIDIAARPDDVVVPPDLVTALEAAGEVVGGALALVSGRSIEQLDRLFAPAKLRASGVHGAEMRFEPEGPTLVSDDDLIPDTVWDEVSEVLTRFPGTLVENKRFSFAIHYRAVPDIGPALTQAIQAIADRHRDQGIRLMPGHFVVELKRATFNKGLALERFMAHPRFAGRRPVFIGDDVTDQPAFVTALSFGGAAYSVGRRLPDTTGTLDSPAEVRRWVKQIASRESLHA